MAGGGGARWVWAGDVLGVELCERENVCGVGVGDWVARQGSYELWLMVWYAQG